MPETMINQTASESCEAGTTSKFKKVGRKILNCIPAAIILGLIALYYIQLSHVVG